MKFQAQIAGAELKKEPDSKFLFKDPKEYENMPMEERKKLTEEMKAHFMSQLGGGKLSG
jgi:hypothetical protein